jgi:hypothetical protein
MGLTFYALGNEYVWMSIKNDNYESTKYRSSLAAWAKKLLF